MIWDEEVIVAQSTSKGLGGAIALIRLTGNDARAIVTKVSKLPSKSIKEVSSHTVHYGFITDFDHNIIDQVMFIVMDGPKTFTGQNTIEITCHNNPFLVEKIIELLILAGARLAEPGEFTKRAYLNKKIDLIQAESINELIGANTQSAIKQSLAQLDGSFSS